MSKINDGSIELCSALEFVNNRFSKEDRENIEQTLIELKDRTKHLKEDLKRMKLDKSMSGKNAVKNLKKLKFISSVHFDGKQLEVLSEDLEVSKNVSPKNWGKYMFKFGDLNNRPGMLHVYRIEGSVDVAFEGLVEHPFVREKRMCFGSSRTSSQFNTLMREGRVDLAVSILWNLLNLKIYGDPTPYVDPSDFAEAVKEQRSSWW